MLLLFLSDANALMPGEIQVSSQLNQPLAARIDLPDLSAADVLQLDAHLASMDEYRKLDLHYPEGHKFRFQLISEPGVQPYLRVFTPSALDEPFVSLLVKFVLPSGTYSKAYTFLLDPSPGWSAMAARVVQPIPDAIFADLHPSPSNVAQPPPLKRHKPKRSAEKIRTVDARVAAAPPVEMHGMKLAMSLSISRYDASAPASEDALQEELIVKGKILEDLTEQITQMHAVINALEARLGRESPALAGSVVLPVSSEALPAPVEMPSSARTSVMNRLNLLLAVMVIVLAAATLFWYRRLASHRRGPFDEVGDAPVPVQEDAAQQLPFEESETVKAAETAILAPEPIEPAPPVPEKVWHFGEHSMEIPAYTEQPKQAVVSSVPPEYAMLLEAKRYLRAGNEPLAEETLLRAIQLNPANPYGYLALLTIYETRGDAAGFAAIAQRLKDNGDESSFRQAAERGRALDPANPLYA